jgi:hypothetical protein
MTINLESDRALDRLMSRSFFVTSVVFNLCLIAQLLTVGVAYFVDPAWWDIHIWLVRGYGGLSLLLMGWSFVIPFSSQIQRLTGSLAVLLGLQFISIHLKPPIHLEVLHPLIGFALFYVSSSLVHRVWRNLSPDPQLDRQIIGDT